MISLKGEGLSLRGILKKIVIPSVCFPWGIAALLMFILHFGGDFPDIYSYAQPRLGAAFAVMLIVSFGLFSVFSKDYLKRLLPWAVILPLLWAGTFTWAYGFASLPEKKHLGDYYVLGALLFSLPYVYTICLTKCGGYVRAALQIMYGAFSFFMLLFPLIYISYYWRFGGEMDLFALMAVRATHWEEVKEFLSTMGSPLLLGWAIGVLLLLLLAAYVLTQQVGRCAERGEGLLRGNGKKVKVSLIVISILFFGGFIRQIIHVFPINLYRTMNSKGSEFQLLQNFNTNLDKNTAGLKFIDPADGLDEGTHIVVIGESANRDHLKAFTPSYPEDTTPWLSSKVNDPDFSLNYMAYSNFPNTLMSLSYAMTSANQYGDMDLSHAVSMVDAARAAGYRTDWISFHNRSSLSSAGVTLIAERSDASFWEKNYDEYAVDVMKKLPPAKRRVLFINIMGSHYTYLARVPADQRGALGISENDPYYGYDLTVAYTDRVIRDIFEYAKAHMNLKSLVYFSDHGENMEHFHSTSPFFYDMVHIPFFVYLSPDYQAAHPSLMPVLKSHEKLPFTNDLAFDTVTGLWRARTNFYHAAYDISSPDYAITIEDAKTFGGKRMVKDDPALAK